jgi:hypothetical protein
VHPLDIENRFCVICGFEDNLRLCQALRLGEITRHALTILYGARGGLQLLSVTQVEAFVVALNKLDDLHVALGGTPIAETKGKDQLDGDQKQPRQI